MSARKLQEGPRPEEQKNYVRRQLPSFNYAENLATDRPVLPNAYRLIIVEIGLNLD